VNVPLLWRIAPRVLFRFPRSAAAVAFGAGVLVLATILGPLFLSSSERASLAAGFDLSGRWEAGLQVIWRAYAYPGRPAEEERNLRLAAEGRRLLAERVAGVSGLGSPTATLLGGEGRAVSEAGDAAVRLVHRTEAYENVTVVERGGPGVWLADVTAAALDVGPGDTIRLTTPGGITRARVGTVYENLRDDPRDFWATLTDFIYKAPDSDTPPPPFVLAGDRFVMDADRTAQIRWNLPLRTTDLPPSELKAIVREFRRVAREVTSDARGIGGELYELGGFAFEPAISTLLPGIVRNAQERLEASQAPTGVVTAAARVLGAGLMVAAGLALVARRRSEVRALIARGAAPASLALRFVAESAAPAALGTIAAVVAGYAGVRAFGAAGAAEWTYVRGLTGEIALAAGAALALLGAATGAAVAREERSFRRRATPASRLVPPVAGAVVAAGGVAAYRSLESISVADSGEPLAGSILLAPIGVIAAGALAAGVLLRLVLPFAAAAARRRSTALFLAAKRLASGSAMTHALVIVCGTALGLTFFGLTVASSVRHTATAKAKTFVGSDLAVGIGPNPAPLPDLAFPATQVTSIDTYLEGTARPVTLLGVEPESFAAAAFWDDEFATERLDDLLALLRDGGGTIPAIAVGYDTGASVAISGSETAIEVVEEAKAFPGMTPGQPLLAMTVDSARRVLATGGFGVRSDQIWAKGDPDEVWQGLVEGGLGAFEPLTVDEVLDTPTIQSIVWSLGLLGGVGALASATAVAGLSLYLQARHTAAQVAAAMTRRMGMRRRAELLSWTAEIGGAGLASFAVGAATGIVTALVVHERLDVLPRLEPEPIFVLPPALVAIAAVAVGAVTAVTARRLQRRMDHAAVGEIMRV
jgi:putative ABC transport system permease protein